MTDRVIAAIKHAISLNPEDAKFLDWGRLWIEGSGRTGVHEYINDAATSYGHANVRLKERSITLNRYPSHEETQPLLAKMAKVNALNAAHCWFLAGEYANQVLNAE